MYLCYTKPAVMNYFGWENEALPLGNGKIGAKVFGGTECELIQFNEKTLWSGGSAVEGFNHGVKNADGGAQVKKIQQLLESGKNKSAAMEMKKLEGDRTGFGSYQAFGNLYLNFGEKTAADKYVRDLDLDSASAMVTYQKNKATFTRHYFVSYPQNCFVARLSSEGENNAFSFDAYVVSDQKGEPVSESDSIFLSGTVNGNLGIDAPPSENKNNMKYGCAVKFIAKDGAVTARENGHISVENTTSVVIIMSLATDYINSFPVFSDGSDPLKKAKAAVLSACKKSFGELYREHLASYRELYNRVTFSLGQEEQSGQSTDFMLSRFGKKGQYKKELIPLLFQYGRYLLISSSRGDTLPANLQGIWNAKNNPPWESDYHFNINVQMNYWPAYQTNLAETALPFISFVNSLKKPGRIVANQTLGIGENTADGKPDFEKPTGWVIHTMVTPLGFTGPGWGWQWGWAPVSGAWAAQNMYDYYRYTRDLDRLSSDIYPAMQEAALLWSSLLTENKKTGRLEVSPCFSPEHGPVSAGGTFEQSIIYNLFESVIEASRELCGAGRENEVDLALIEKLTRQLDRLQPYSVTKKGMIREWADEDKFFMGGKALGVQKHHRHISHLLGLYPFKQITHDTPDLMKAAEKSLDDRGIKTTGWALAQRLLCYARLGKGEKCAEVITQTFKTAILKNLFGSHPPFQIDGNFGFTAGVAQMLLQSHEGCIRLLPALPSDWREGSFTGLCCEGGFEVDAEWKDGKLKSGKIKAVCGGVCRMMYDGKIILVSDENGSELDTEFADGVTSFIAEKGKTYTFS